jgi:hypothetical protein
LLRLEAQADLAPGTAVQIHNPYGDVRLRPLAGRLEASAQTQVRLPQTCQPALQLEPMDGGLRLEAHCPPDAQGLLRLDMTVFLPKDTPLTVRTQHGLIDARGLTGLTAQSQQGNIRYRGPGALTAATERGTIHATFTGHAWANPSQLRTTTGDITTQLRGAPPICIALTTHGVISTDYSLTIQHDPLGPEKHGIAELGNCQARLILESVKGNLQLIRLPELP